MVIQASESEYLALAAHVLLRVHSVELEPKSSRKHSSIQIQNNWVAKITSTYLEATVARHYLLST